LLNAIENYGFWRLLATTESTTVVEGLSGLTQLLQLSRRCQFRNRVNTVLAGRLAARFCRLTSHVLGGHPKPAIEGPVLSLVYVQLITEQPRASGIEYTTLTMRCRMLPIGEIASCVHRAYVNLNEFFFGLAPHPAVRACLPFRPLPIPRLHAGPVLPTRFK
jgi:hypothetical protein